MKMISAVAVALGSLSLAGMPAFAGESASPAISGAYLETRSCDVYTGACFANGEMNLVGKEGILVWSVRQGAWKGTPLDGLSVIAVVRANKTMGDVKFEPRSGKAILIVDSKANARQREALCDLARSHAGELVKEVVDVKMAPIDCALGTCDGGGCASVKAGDLVQIKTRCLGGKDHLCGNEETYYPPLTAVDGAYPAFTEIAAFKGKGLGLNWEDTGSRSAFLASFSK